MAAPPSPSSLRACAACGNPVDPLRAPVVAILDGRFTYFCSVDCKRSTSALSLVPPPVRERPTRAPEPVVEPAVAPEPVVEPAVAPEPVVEPAVAPEPVVEPADAPEPAPPPPVVDVFTPPPAYVAEPDEPARASLPPVAPVSRVSTAVPSSPVPYSSSSPSSSASSALDRTRAVLRPLALVAAALAVVFALVDAQATLVRLGLSTASTVLLVLGVASSRRRRTRPTLLESVEAELGAPLLGAALAATAAVVLAWVLLGLGKPGAGTAIAAGVWIVLAAAAAEVVAHAALGSTLESARALLASLEEGDRLPLGEVVELRPGDRVRADLAVLGGEVVCEQWGNPVLRATRRAGDAIPAGSWVQAGSARARVVSVDSDRTFARALADAMSRPDRGSPGVRTLDRAAPWIVVAVVVAAIALGILSKGTLGPTIAAGIAAGASILVAPARRLAVRDQLRGIVEASRRGAAFADAASFVRAGTVRTVVFCARGTVVAGVPDACDVEEITGLSTPNEVLGLALGAERGVDHPIAEAIRSSAKARGVRAVEVRNVVVEPGLGVVGELAPDLATGPSSGDARGAAVVVGGRSLCLREHVPTAEHEARITELERRGREVVLVAKGGRVVGLLALHSAIRAGALAAVQRLHDVDVEPVLLGGSARERLEAVGRAVDIEHVRPEVVPKERGAEVRRIAQSGGKVAVIGRPGLDATALAAADVAIALDAPRGGAEAREGGRTGASIALVHDQLVSSADVLALAQATRAKVVATLTVGLAPAALAALPVAFGLVRPAWAPLAALAATVALGVRDLVAAALPEGGRIDDTR